MELKFRFSLQSGVSVPKKDGKSLFFDVNHSSESCADIVVSLTVWGKCQVYINENCGADTSLRSAILMQEGSPRKIVGRLASAVRTISKLSSLYVKSK